MKGAPRPPWGRPLPDARACPAPVTPPQDRALGLNGPSTSATAGQGQARRPHLAGPGQSLCQPEEVLPMPAGLGREAPSPCRRGVGAGGSGHRTRELWPPGSPPGFITRRVTAVTRLQAWLEGAPSFRWTADSRAGVKVGGWCAVGAILASFLPVHPSSVFNELARQASSWSPALLPVWSRFPHLPSVSLL